SLRDGSGHARGERQLDRERRAASGLALAGDRAAVRLYDRLRDREPEADAGNRIGLRALGPEEAFEEVRLLFLRDPDAGVAHLDPRATTADDGADVHAAAARGELERVRDEVVEHLSDPDRVGGDRRQLLRLGGELDP